MDPDYQTTTPREVFAFGATELGHLPDTPLSTGLNDPFNFPLVYLDYKSPVSTTEVCAFLRDPHELTGQTFHDIPLHERTVGNDARWAKEVEDVQFSPPAACAPTERVGPTDGSDNGTVTNEADAFYQTRMFLPLGVLPEGIAAEPDETGSIKGVRVYDHGPCSATTELAPLYSDILGAIFAKFQSGVKASSFGLGHATPQWTHAVTSLNHEPGRGANDHQDGFILDANYDVDYEIVFLGADKVSYTALYEFGLEKGILNATLVEQTHSIHGFDADDIKHELVDIGLKKEVPAGVLAETTKRQTKKIPMASSPCLAVTDCRGAANNLGTAVIAGAQALGISGLGAQLAQSVGGLNDPTTLPERWSCVTEEDERMGTCEFIVPAKRINVYPDAVELVWFDGPEATNAAFALYVATFASPLIPPADGKKAREELCAAKSPHADEGFFTRPLAIADNLRLIP